METPRGSRASHPDVTRLRLPHSGSVLALTSLLFLGALAAPAAAQSASPQEPAPQEGAATALGTETAPAGPKRHRFSLGLSGGPLLTNTDGLDGATFGGVFRWRGQDDSGGWGPSFEFSSFRSSVEATLAAGRQSVGRVEARALMGGVDYEIRRGDWTYEVGVVGGWSFNDIDPSDAVIAEGRVLDIDVSGSVAFGPTFTLWYDIPNTRLAITTTAECSMTRPEVSYRTDAGSFSQRRWLTALSLRAGFAVGLF